MQTLFQYCVAERVLIWESFCATVVNREYYSISILYFIYLVISSILFDAGEIKNVIIRTHCSSFCETMLNKVAYIPDDVTQLMTRVEGRTPADLCCSHSSHHTDIVRTVSRHICTFVILL